MAKVLNSNIIILYCLDNDAAEWQLSGKPDPTYGVYPLHHRQRVRQFCAPRSVSLAGGYLLRNGILSTTLFQDVRQFLVLVFLLDK